MLGGGGFLGFHVVAAGLAAGHEMSVLSRSGSSPHDGVEVLTGDREGDLAALRGREWDAVLDTFTDTSPGAPAIRATAELLHGSVGAYGYVSGMSVYAPSGPPVPDEGAPVRRQGVEPDNDPLQQRSLAKLSAEAVLGAVLDVPVLLPRVGILTGPRDPSGRFTYWPRRMARALSGQRGRTVLVPGALDRAVQHSDARDVAAWVVAMLAQGRGGTFDTVGPGRRESLAEVLEACVGAAGGAPGDVQLVEVDEDFLRQRLGALPEEGRPLWFPEEQIPQDAIDSTAAIAAGLTFRPARDTATDVLGSPADGGVGLDTGALGALEQALLREWAARR